MDCASVIRGKAGHLVDSSTTRSTRSKESTPSSSHPQQVNRESLPALRSAQVGVTCASSLPVLQAPSVRCSRALSIHPAELVGQIIRSDRLGNRQDLPGGARIHFAPAAVACGPKLPTRID